MLGLLVAGIIGLISLGFFHGSAKIPDGRDANLMRYVFVAISEITQDQVEYSTVGTEAVRALIHNNVLWKRDHTSENVIISYPFGGVLEIHDIEDNLVCWCDLLGRPR